MSGVRDILSVTKRPSATLQRRRGPDQKEVVLPMAGPDSRGCGCMTDAGSEVYLPTGSTGRNSG